MMLSKDKTRESSEQARLSGSSGSRDELTTFTFSAIVLQQRAMGASYVRLQEKRRLQIRSGRRRHRPETVYGW